VSRAIATLALAAAIPALAACGESSKPPPGELQRLGAPEGALDLIALPGYVEDGSQDPSRDWVTPFERETGCRVSSTTASAPDEIDRLMRTGRYDGVSARGDVSGRLISEHLVAPVNAELIPSSDQIFPALKHVPADTADGVSYGIPIGRLANLLIWEPSQVRVPRDKPVSSKLIFDPSVASQYRGRVSAYGDPMFIADAALYLRDHDPGLGIHNIYELDQEQLDAAIALLRQQRPNVGSYWTSSARNVKAFAREGAVVGPAWQVTINRLLADRVKLQAIVPEEGGTAITESWMLSSHAQHPNCMYMWMNYISGARANAALAENTGQAPASEHACDETRDPAWCDTYRAADEDLFKLTHYWQTPLSECGDDRGDSCKTYDDWARAFAGVMARR
jgi:putative spermidine/putrescine transport system substrate-binding protein